MSLEQLPSTQNPDRSSLNCKMDLQQSLVYRLLHLDLGHNNVIEAVHQHFPLLMKQLFWLHNIVVRGKLLNLLV